MGSNENGGENSVGDWPCMENNVQQALTWERKFLNLFVVKASAIFIVVLVAVGFVGCGKGTSDGSIANAQADAAKIFLERCSTCHGPNGAGDGPAGANLNPKPRNLQDASWQASVDDAYLEKLIKLGGLGVGKSAAMPANPDISDNEPVVKALVTKVRSLTAR
jgi:mono/diheme cytochrome c family protein